MSRAGVATLAATVDLRQRFGVQHSKPETENEPCWAKARLWLDTTYVAACDGGRIILAYMGLRPFDALAVDGWKGGQSRMSPDQEAALCDWLDGRFCRSTVEIREHISKEFGLRYAHSGCIKLLARLGYEYRKPKGLPRVASAEKQAEFIALYERLLNGLGADEAVYFADAVHPEYQTKPSYGWVKAGSNPAVTPTAGRGRVNIHGALNLVD